MSNFLCPPSPTVPAPSPFPLCCYLFSRRPSAFIWLWGCTGHTGGRIGCTGCCWPTSLVSVTSLPRLSTTEFRLSHMKLPLFSGQKWLNIGSFRWFNQKTFFKVLNTVLPVHSRCLADICSLIINRKREPIKWNNIPLSSLIRVKPL